MEKNQIGNQGDVTGQASNESSKGCSLVTPGALNQCIARWSELDAQILDISFVRLVLQESEPWPAIVEGQSMIMQLFLNGYDFSTEVTIQGRGEGWLRFQFEKWVPSAKSQLRTFLCPKKVGESMFADNRVPAIRHYHGLNESELWFDKKGNVLFTYLDHIDPKYQFLVQANLEFQSVKIGRLTRNQYMAMDSIDGELGLIPLSDKENYSRMSECRDIVTNFRPNGQIEYHLKQRLLKLISDNLYSTGHRVDYPLVRPIRVPSLSTEH